MCEWGVEDPATWAEKVGNSWRTTGDISDSWDSFLEILDKQYGLEKYAGPGGWNDPDMLEVGNGGMTDNEYQAHFALWALLKAPLLLGCDLNKLSKETLAIIGNEDIIAINQDILGVQGKRVFRSSMQTGFIEVYAGELSNGIAIILFNRSKYAEKITANFKDCGFKGKGGNVRNLITGENYGYIEDSFSEVVPSHSVVVVKLHQYCHGKHCQIDNVHKNIRNGNNNKGDSNSKLNFLLNYLSSY
jgi:alpha-galactosidase